MADTENSKWRRKKKPEERNLRTEDFGETHEYLPEFRTFRDVMLWSFSEGILSKLSQKRV